MDPISPDVQALLRDHIEGFDQLEVLLFLHRCRGVLQSSKDVAAATSLPLDLVGPALEHLKTVGIVEALTGSNPGYRFPTGSSAHDGVMAHLVDAYATNRIGLITLMTDHAIQRVRAAAIRTFADAFVLEKTDTDRKKRDG